MSVVALCSDGSLEQALLACGRREPGSICFVFNREARRMHHYAMGIIRNTSLAKYAVQDSFVLIWQHAIRYDPAKGNATGWIYTILRNRCFTLKRQSDRMLPTPVEYFDSLAASADDPEKCSINLSDIDLLNSALATLALRHRKLVEMNFFEELSATEIAIRLSMPLGTVKSNLRRSLIALRDSMLVAGVDR